MRRRPIALPPRAAAFPLPSNSLSLPSLFLCRHVLLRDVYAEMSLCGVRPSRELLHLALTGCLRARRLPDAEFFWKEMRRRGARPTEGEYAAMVTTLARHDDQLYRALEVKCDMQAAGLTPTPAIFVSLLNALSHAGRAAEARGVYHEMRAAGHPVNEWIHAALIDALRHVPAERRPADAAAQVLALLEEGRAELAARRAAGQAQQQGRADGDGTGVVLLSAALETLCELGCHDAAAAVYEQGLAAGVPVNTKILESVMAVYLQKALGDDRRLRGKMLGEWSKSRAVLLS